MKKALFLVTASLLGITTTFAQGQVDGSAPLGLLALAQTIVNRLSPFLVTVALLAFFWYLIKFIVQGGQSADAKAASIKGMGWAIFALFVMVSIWGIITLMASLLGIDQNARMHTFILPGQEN